MKIGSITGLAIGDALGAPWEFKHPSTVKKAEWQGEYLPTPRMKIAEGQWTDDTKMAIQLAISLIEAKKFDPELTAAKYIQWVNTGDLRGIGNQTNIAISRMIEGEKLSKCGEINHAGYQSSDYCGNGTIMRVAPIAVFLRDDIDEMIKAAGVDAILTHSHTDAIESSVAMCMALVNAEESVNDQVEAMMGAIDNKGNCAIKILQAYKLLGEDFDKATNELGNSGRADETLGSSLWCFWTNHDDFKGAVIDGVKMGGDADTRAAIVGALSGARVGLENIPKNYVREVESSELLKALDILLYNKGEMPKDG